MRFFKYAVLIVIVLAIAGSLLWFMGHSRVDYVPYNAELEYLKAINGTGPAQDPRIPLLLMAEFINAKRTEEGITTFSYYIDKYRTELSEEQRATYLSALGLLRAIHTREVFPIKQYSWVRSTIDQLEEARSLSKDQVFFVRWITGLVYAQLPAVFNKRDAGKADLEWCIQNVDRAPDYGWIREAYYHLGLIHHKEGNETKAQELLQLSGYKSFEKSIILTTNFSAELKKGHIAGPRQMHEVVPGKIFTLTGFEFADFNFVITEDGQELIAVDAGTTPGSAQQAYEHLKSKVPNLPRLTRVFVTHAHWDHLGGHRYFRELNPEVKFYVRENYEEELKLVLQTPLSFPYFLGTSFHYGLVTDFKPTDFYDDRSQMTVGGTQFEIIPVSGGETRDAVFIHLPQYSVMFIGDFLMPYFGGPFKEEGNIPGLFDAIDTAVQISPKHLIHGHDALTKILANAEIFADLKKDLTWLYHTTLDSLHKGSGRAALHHKNFIPPNASRRPENQIAYLAMRENFINRTFDRDQGYWEIGDLTGLKYLSEKEYGALLVDYLDLSEDEIADAVQRMVKNGDYLLAEDALKWSMTNYPDSERLKKLRKETYSRLMEKYQALSPFKFIIYSEMIQQETPQLEKR